jgi:hypothetical protein
MIHLNIKQAASVYAKQKSLSKTAKILGVDDSTLRYQFSKWGVPINKQGGSKNRYLLNANYFEKIDSEEKAYWLGFLFADGSVYVGKQGYKLTVRLATKDRGVIESLFKALEADNPIKNEKQYKKGKQYKKRFYLCSVGVISSKKLVCDLCSHGCIPNKSFKLKFPQLLPGLEPHFIRGYFDGDGCICRNIWCVLGNRPFLKRVQKALMTIGLNKTKIMATGRIFRLSYNGRYVIAKLTSYLYKDATICLNRKKEKMVACCLPTVR